MLKIYSHFDLTYMKFLLARDSIKKVEPVKESNKNNTDNYSESSNNYSQRYFTYEKKIKKRKQS